MATCPRCGRNSLEFSEPRKAAWCLYAQCGFMGTVNDYDDYVSKFEKPSSAHSATRSQEPTSAG